MNNLDINQLKYPSNYMETYSISTEGILNCKHVIVFTTPNRTDFAGQNTPWETCFKAIFEQFNKLQTDQKERILALPCLEAEFYKGKKEEMDAEVAMLATTAATDFVQKNVGTKILFLGEGNNRIAKIYEAFCLGVAEVSVDAKSQAASANTTAIALPLKKGTEFSGSKSALALAAKTAGAIKERNQKLEQAALAGIHAAYEKALVCRKRVNETFYIAQRAHILTWENSLPFLIKKRKRYSVCNTAIAAVVAAYGSTWALDTRDRFHSSLHPYTSLSETQFGRDVVSRAFDNAQKIAWEAFAVLNEAQKALGSHTKEHLIKEKQRVNDITNEVFKIAKGLKILEDGAAASYKIVTSESSETDIAKMNFPQQWKGVRDSSFLRNCDGWSAYYRDLTKIDKRLLDPVYTTYYQYNENTKKMEQTQLLENPTATLDDIDNEFELRYNHPSQNVIDQVNAANAVATMEVLKRMDALREVPSHVLSIIAGYVPEAAHQFH